MIESIDLIQVLAEYPLVIVLVMLYARKSSQYANLLEYVKEQHETHTADLRKRQDDAALNAITHAVRHTQYRPAPPGDTLIE